MNKAQETEPEYLSENLWDTERTADYLDQKPAPLRVWRCTKAVDLRPIKIGGSVKYCPVFIREYANKKFMGGK